MQVKQLLKEDDAVSPVIGVILMVAITVILAAVIASFVLGMGNDMGNSAPQASFSVDYEQGSSDTLTISHDGGDTVNGEQLYVTISGAASSDVNGEHDWTGGSGIGGDTTLKSGQVATIDDSDFSPSSIDLSQAQVTVSWEAPDGSSTTTIKEWSGPDA